MTGPDATPPAAAPKTFTANYPGKCAECWERIKPGDEVGYKRHSDRHGEDVLVCADCLDGTASRPLPDVYAPAVACPDCWLIHPEGTCDR